MGGRTPSLRWLRRLVTVFFLTASGTVAIGQLPASSQILLCPAFPADWDIEGYDAARGDTLRGIRGTIKVNDFSGPQWRSIRSVNIFKSSNNYAELGWHAEGTQYVVNKVFTRDGVYYHQHIARASLTPGTYHSFKVHDANGDRRWSFAYDGDALGDESVPNMGKGLAFTLSEVHCELDSAWAHFKDLDDCTNSGCPWNHFGGLAKLLDENPDYNFDKVDNSEHYVRRARTASTPEEPTGPRWSSWEPHAGLVDSGLDVASWAPNRLDVFGRDSAGQLLHKSWDGTTWSGWESLGAPATPAGTRLTSDPAAVSWGNNRIDVFARGADDALWTKVWDGTNWSNWIALGAPTAPGGGAPAITSGPDATSWAVGRLDVAVLGPDNAVYHRWYESGWSAWERHEGAMASGPSTISWGSGRLDLFAMGTDNTLQHKWWEPWAGWSAWESLGGVLTAGPDASSWASGQLDVFARGSAGDLVHKWWDGTGWSTWESLGGSLSPNDPGAISWDQNRIDVFVRWSDGAMYHRWYA
jgi:hypothetical protein